MNEFKVTVIPLLDDAGGMTASEGIAYPEIAHPSLAEAMRVAGEEAAVIVENSRPRPCALNIRVQVPA